MAHVPITRTFYDLKGTIHHGGLSPEQRELMGIDATTWNTLLADHASHLVLVAPSGSGKTSEMVLRATALRSDGGHAFYARARHVASEGFVQSLEAAEAAAFDAWLASDSHATIFLDGVDELPLVNRDFGSFVRHVGRALAGAHAAGASGDHRYRLVLSTRTGGWTPAYEGMLTTRALPMDARPVRQVGFERLGRSAIRDLAVGAGCAEVGRFMDSLAREEIAELIEIRPCDVAPLVRRWQHAGRIGPISNVLSELVDRALDESNLERARSLTLEGGRVAAQRLGATAVFCKTPFVSLPTTPSAPGRVSGRALFEDWPWPQIAELFETHLFVPKGEEAVQLLQGPLPAFLSARWITARVAGGRRSDWVRDLLLVRVHDLPEWHVPQSRRDTLGWVLSQLPELRRLVIANYPDVILFEGDPERLRDDEVIACLRRHVVQLDENEHVNGTWVRSALLRKLARRELEPAVVSLLASARGGGSTEHLLRWCEVGRYASALERAREIALDATRHARTRCAALGVLRESGPIALREELRALLNVEDEDIRVEVARCLIPDVLHGPDLVGFVLGGTGLSFALTMRRLGDMMSIDDLAATLRGVSVRDHEPDGAWTATDDAWPTLLAGLVISYLARERAEPELAAQALLSLEHASAPGRGHLSGRDVRTIDELLESSIPVRRALWRARLSSASWARATLGARSVQDIAWLLDEASSSAVPWHCTLWVGAIVDGLTAAELGQLATDSTVDPRVRELLEQRQRATEAHARHEAAREAERQAERDALKASAIEAFFHRRDAIASGSDLPALRQAWGALRPQLLSRRGSGLRDLEARIGPDLAEAFLSGYRSSWRSLRVPAPRPHDNSVNLDACVGLVGLQLDFDAGLDVRTLTSDEAEIAARHAVHELNGFPSWFEALIDAHESVVHEVLRELVLSFWEAKDATFGPLARVQDADLRAAALLRSIAIELLLATLANGASQVHSAVDAVLLSPSGTAPVLARIEKYIADSSDGDGRLPELLRAWAHLAPMTAATWFEQHFAQRRPGIRELFVTTAGLLEEDFDERRSRLSSSALLAPAALERWAALLLSEVPIHEDPTHDGIYSPDSRDQAAEFRGRCLGQLARDPSFAAYNAISNLQTRPWPQYEAGYVARLKDAHLATAAEAATSPWSVADILALERKDDRRPSSLEDFFHILRRHLEDVCATLETSEFSYRALFTAETHEREIQLWVAETLRQRAGRLYSVVRENVVSDDKEVDITAVADGIGQIPIEIKPLKRYSLSELEKTISEQLIGRYMTQPDRRFGILFLVHHTERTWTIEGRDESVEKLLLRLDQYARGAGAREGKVVVVQLVRAV